MHFFENCEECGLRSPCKGHEEKEENKSRPDLLVWANDTGSLVPQRLVNEYGNEIHAD